jgi:UV DNA damage repair endonuclease
MQADFHHGLLEHVGAKNITPSVEAALERAREIWTRSTGDAAAS